MSIPPDLDALSDLPSDDLWELDPALTLASGPAHRRGEAAADWSSAGQLQLDFLRTAGLMPQHRVLDIGCGALRAGAKLIAYLEPGNYYGIDSDKAQLDAGHELELGALNLAKRCPRANLAHAAKFRHPQLTEPLIDFGLCISVMRGLTISHVQVCLERVAPYFKPGAQLLVSYLELPGGRPLSTTYTNMARFASHGVMQPLHFYRRDMEQAGLTSHWRARYIGQWGHADGEVMMSYEKI